VPRDLEQGSAQAGVELVLADLVAGKVEMHVDDFDHVPAQNRQMLVGHRFHGLGVNGRGAWWCR